MLGSGARREVAEGGSLGLAAPAVPRPRRGPVLRLAILIADAGGEILYWNAEARAALDRLPAGRPIRRLDELLAPAALDRLYRGGWSEVHPLPAADRVWSVRVRRLLESGRSLVLFHDGGP